MRVLDTTRRVHTVVSPDGVPSDITEINSVTWLDNNNAAHTVSLLPDHHYTDAEQVIRDHENGVL